MTFEEMVRDAREISQRAERLRTAAETWLDTDVQDGVLQSQWAKRLHQGVRALLDTEHGLRSFRSAATGAASLRRDAR